MYNKRKWVLGIVGGVMAVFILFGSASAAILQLDHFQTGTAQTVIDAVGGSSTFGYVNVGWGGQRDVILNAQGTTGELRLYDAANVAGDTIHYLEITGSGDASGSVEIQYDGNSDSSATLFYGLAAGYRDMINATPAPANNSLHIEVLRNDVPTQMVVRFYTDATHWSEYAVTMPGGINGRVAYVFAFSAFSQGAGAAGPVTWTDVRAWTASFTTNVPGMFIRIEQFDTSDKQDRGDLPATYGAGGYGDPRHTPIGLWMGTVIDAEENDMRGTNATGDDTTPPWSAIDDEDGVTRVGSWSDGTGTVSILVSGAPGMAGCLSGWLDYTDGTSYVSNGSFDQTGEQIINNQPVSLGTNVFNFSLPLGAANNATWYARFRLVNDTGTPGCADQSAVTAYTGYMDSGEVEDYRWLFNPTAVDVVSLAAYPSLAVSPLVALPLVGIVLAGGLFAFKRRQGKQ